MKRILKPKSPAVEPIAQPDLSSTIGRIQQQLTFLEKKIDTLIAQSAAKPSERKEYGNPSRRFDSSFRRDRGDRENSFRDRSFTKAICAECKTECEVPFRPTGDRPVYCKDCFAKHKDREGSPAREDRSFGGRKKPIFRKRSRNRA
jgi:CxxC-x17-CxxC domain-containing protein